MGGVTVGLSVGVTVGLTSDAVVALRSPHEGSLRDALLFGLAGDRWAGSSAASPAGSSWSA